LSVGVAQETRTQALGGLAARLQLDVTRRDEDRVVAGVCSGIAAALGVDATLVRLVFALLAVASGSGIVLYFALWLLLPEAEEEPPAGAARAAGLSLLIAGGILALRGLGLADSLLWPAALVAGGAALMLRRHGARHPGRNMALGLALVVAGSITFLNVSPFSSLGGRPLAPGAVAVVLVAVVGPWLWRLVRERDAERLERIRADERAEVAARVHDSVLQTLALIQRHADDARQVGALARQQERELRSSLYGNPARRAGGTLVDALERAAAEIEERHGVRVEVVSAGDHALDDGLDALVLAAREAMTNAAKFSGEPEISVYAESVDDRVSVFVRDRGVGFERASVPPDHRGVAESIEGRMSRNGGSATVTSSPGGGTEVELTIPGSTT
jgi:signal transduction histidine kinase